MAETAPLKWSGSFAILPHTAPSCRDLSGDKIILPPSVLEQLLTAASLVSRQGPEWGAALNADNSAHLPNPLVFRLSSSKGDKVVFAGIREFSAPEGTIGLSPFLLEALDVKPDDCTSQSGDSQDDAIDLTTASGHSEPVRLGVQVVSLPKGTFVRLRPLEAGYDPDDWKPLLERQLRQNFTSLTFNTTLSVGGVRGEEFKLLIDKLAPEGSAVCVVDTDLEVEIEALNEEQARETLRQRIARGQTATGNGSSKGGELDIWKDADGHVAPGEYVDYVLPSWDRSQNLSITLQWVDDERCLDLFATPKSREQRALPRDSVHVFGDFSQPHQGSKTISISPTNIALEGAESILISVHGYLDPETTKEPARAMSYTIRARISPPRGNDPAEPIVLSEPDDQPISPDDERCGNCFQWVPKRTMVLHHNFCLRNNVLCPLCKSVFKKISPEWESHWHCEHDEAHGNSPASKARHEFVYHSQHRCPSCDFSTNSLPDLARHRTSVCPQKIILCRFCHLEVPQEGDPLNPSPEVVMSGMTAHELADGSRTTECHLCDKIVRLRDMETHMKHHELDKSTRLKPLICRNVLCGRTLFGVGPRGKIGSYMTPIKEPGNDLGFCSVCFGPLYVSLNDPDGRAMRRRIERRYLGQLLSGCQKPYCLNQWCKTGRSNTGTEAGTTSPSRAVQPLVAGALDPGEPAYFCVDEDSQMGRKVAEMVAAERAWDLEWCVAAAEVEKHQADRMRDWLHAWAPRRQK
ncbi:Ubiquitin fusion degradation protein 1 [Escovopsis weberi]|uniref:Ubiquitin fusion degradation protein 1 n=1 Tax=Escovopsis weberi TaxID=150374 RepID=A0A0M8N508_ESCWE|nr:Ubiquitin fusion degradation protein 1 [Escovopsis weberi]